MPLDKDTELAISTLIEFGIISPEGCRRFADMVRNLRKFANAFPAVDDPGYGDARPEASAELSRFWTEPPTEAPTEARPTAKRRRRAPKGTFKLSKEELQKLRETMTVKQIAEAQGVSPGTVNAKLREYGLTQPGKRGRPPKA